MIPGPRATLPEIAAWVSTFLAAHGIRTVLVGGAAVSAYTKNLYQSLDVDLATMHGEAPIAKAMLDLGFRKTGRVWHHPRFPATVDFVAGPPAVGSLVLRNFKTIKFRSWSVQVITPTQSLMDRLAAFYHWNDRQGLEQALLLAMQRKINYPTVASWSRNEGMADKYREFRRVLTERCRKASLKHPRPR